MEIDFELIIQLQQLDSDIRNAALVIEGIPRLVQDVDKLHPGHDEARRRRQGQDGPEPKESAATSRTRSRTSKVQVGKYKRQLKRGQDQQGIHLAPPRGRGDPAQDRRPRGIHHRRDAGRRRRRGGDQGRPPQAEPGEGRPREGETRPRREAEGDRVPLRGPEQGAGGPRPPHPPRTAQDLRVTVPEEGRRRPLPGHRGILRHVPHARPPADAQRDPRQDQGRHLRSLRPHPLPDGPSPSRSSPGPQPPNSPRGRVSRRSTRRPARPPRPPGTWRRSGPGIRP